MESRAGAGWNVGIAAVHEAPLEAMGAGGGGEDCGLGPGAAPEEARQRIDFQHFLDLLQARGPLGDLKLHDSRLSAHTSRHASEAFGFFCIYGVLFTTVHWCKGRQSATQICKQ